MSRMRRRVEERRQLEQERREAIERALGEAQIIGGRSAAGDPRSLRGIPMIGSECGGAIPGTVPHRNRRLDRWSGRG